MLVRWIEYDETQMRYFRAKRPRYGSESLMPNVKEDYPAVVALKKVGAAAAPRLVDEYVYFFENTRPEAWAGRCGLHAADQHFQPLPERSPNYRLFLIWTILTERPEVAQKAVEIASGWMPRYPEGDRRVRACESLIRDIVSHYPERDRPKLFPGVVSSK
jgi:hypothetical protein